MSTSQDSDQNDDIIERTEGAISLQYSCSEQKTSEMERKKKKEYEEIMTVKVLERTRMMEKKIQETSNPGWTNAKTRSSESTRSMPLTQDKSKKKITQFKNHNTNDIDLLLIGKTGNGKSATGNTILGRKHFKSEASCTSVTQDVDYETTCYNGRQIKVVDGPGVGDTGSIDDLEEATKLVIDKMSEAVLINPQGYHALLLVVRYGGRFTKEDKEMIRMLKAIFGPDFVRNYGILVVTCGDMFITQQKIQNRKGFKEWCKEQKGVFQELLQECDNRAVLFDNETTHFTTRKKQMTRLIETVDKLQYGGRRYTNENFQRVEEARDLLLVQVKEPVIREATLKQIRIIMQRLDEIPSGNADDNQIKLEELLKMTEELLEGINSTDKGSGILKQTCLSVETLKKSVTDKLKNEKVILEAKLDIARKEEEAKQKYEEATRKGKEELEKLMKDQELKEKKREKEQELEAQKRREADEKMRKEIERREEQIKNELEKERERAQKSLEEQKRQYDELMANAEISNKEREKLQAEIMLRVREKEREIESSRANEKKMKEDNEKEKAALKQKQEEDRKSRENELQQLKDSNKIEIDALKLTLLEADKTAKEYMSELNTENANQLKALQKIIADSNKKHNEAIGKLNQDYMNAKRERDDLIKKNKEMNDLIEANKSRCAIS